MEQTTLDVQPLGGSGTHPEPPRQSLKKQIVISLLCTCALVAAFATGRVTAGTTSVDLSGRDSVVNVGLRNEEASDVEVRGSLSEELSEIWAALEGLRTDTGTQNSELTNQINQESADRQAAVAQLNVSLQTTSTNLEDLVTTTGANLTADLQEAVSQRAEAVATATSTLQSSIDTLDTTLNADLATEAAARDASDANLENILACRPGLIRDPNDSTKCIPCSENQFWSARTGGCNDCPAHSTAAAGSTQCTCDAGFTGDNCEVNIDDCATNPCQNGGTCTDGVESHTCECAGGFTGDNCEIAPPAPTAAPFFAYFASSDTTVTTCSAACKAQNPDTDKVLWESVAQQESYCKEVIDSMGFTYVATLTDYNPVPLMADDGLGNHVCSLTSDLGASDHYTGTGWFLCRCDTDAAPTAAPSEPFNTKWFFETSGTDCTKECQSVDPSTDVAVWPSVEAQEEYCTEIAAELGEPDFRTYPGNLIPYFGVYDGAQAVCFTSSDLANTIPPSWAGGYVDGYIMCRCAPPDTRSAGGPGAGPAASAPIPVGK